MWTEEVCKMPKHSSPMMRDWGQGLRENVLHSWNTLLQFFSSNFMYFMSMYGMHVCVYLCVCAIVHKYKSEGSFGELVLFLNHVGSWDQVQVIRLGGKYLYSLSHLYPTFFPLK